MQRGDNVPALLGRDALRRAGEIEPHDRRGSRASRVRTKFARGSRRPDRHSRRASWTVHARTCASACRSQLSRMRLACRPPDDVQRPECTELSRSGACRARRDSPPSLCIIRCARSSPSRIAQLLRLGADFPGRRAFLQDPPRMPRPSHSFSSQLRASPVRRRSVFDRSTDVVFVSP